MVRFALIALIFACAAAVVALILGASLLMAFLIYVVSGCLALIGSATIFWFAQRLSGASEADEDPSDQTEGRPS
ncbi:hypothetical protein EF888_04755 [Silicimonas algicola]|uniref:Uncharacterized protein n=1 Tax=Silicimonas algicola TaxID=1826607 RepID=A0A316GUV6_9RHOB|nr:hypothetical protein [Silicimonas algicola]AZQ66508.1 hypothetical protein EF888_04755 [Silicimonas algicola]PWK58847.1 hypothetical protein C8D95_101663 [Silicimonas algicola]